MSVEEIIEGNKLIAEFMGAEKSTKDNDMRYIRFSEPHAGTKTFYFYKWQLKYHKSWDWLMPVVEKIEECEDVKVLMNGSKTSIKIDKKTFTCHTIVRINSTWRAVVSFLKYYNSQSNPA